MRHLTRIEQINIQHISILEVDNAELRKEKEQLIEYLEKFIEKTDYQVNVIGDFLYFAWSNAYKNLLEKVRSGKYEFE